MKSRVPESYRVVCKTSKGVLKVAVKISMLLFALSTHVAWATHLPQGSKYDTRIQYVDYNADEVVIIQAYPGLGAQVVFSPEEKIVDIACGFSQGWEVLDKGNTLYLKPRSVKVSDDQTLLPEAGKWDTNLLVTTSKYFYAFDLYLIPGSENTAVARSIKEKSSKDKSTIHSSKKSMSSASRIPHARAAYRIVFRYPQEKIAKVARLQQATQVGAAQKSAAVNWQYSMQVGKNAQSIVPSIAYDDGRFTYFQFPNNQDFPAVFVSAADGSEYTVNTHVDTSTSDEAEELLVVHQVAPKMVLRSGKAVVSIYNDHFNPRGIAPHHGTSIPGLKRRVRTEGSTLEGSHDA